VWEDLHLGRRQGRMATAVVGGDHGACCAKKGERKWDKYCCSTSLGSNKVISLILGLSKSTSIKF